jgi:hypothetical protein
MGGKRITVEGGNSKLQEKQEFGIKSRKAIPCENKQGDGFFINCSIGRCGVWPFSLCS